MNASEMTDSDHMPSIDLNADLGEGCSNDRALLGLVSSASISCGAHAGSPEVIRQTLCDARDLGIVVGAHPGYPDREHFGRREQAIASKTVRNLILEQVANLSTLGAEVGILVRFLKPHGALYNQAQRQEEIARGVIEATVKLGIPLLGQPGSLLDQLASAKGVYYIAEGFPDRRYRDDGSLVPRSEPNAVLHTPEEIEAQLVRLITEGRVKTLCIHGDDPRAVANAELVRGILQRLGVRIASLFAGAPNERLETSV